jgi:hypothetical protein
MLNFFRNFHKNWRTARRRPLLLGLAVLAVLALAALLAGGLAGPQSRGGAAGTSGPGPASAAVATAPEGAALAAAENPAALAAAENPAAETSAAGQIPAAAAENRTSDPAGAPSSPSSPSSSSPSPSPAPTGGSGSGAALAGCLEDGLLTSAGDEALARSYVALLDMASILCFQAGAERPDDPDVWKRLASLSETRGFFTSDPGERSELMEAAAAHFGHAARLEFERASELPGAAGTPPPPPAPDDPYLTELVWDGRLRRGEVTLAELRRRHAAENVAAARRPEYWLERPMLILAAPDGASRARALEEARAEFDELWGDMPVEVPVPGTGDKFGSWKLKKVEVLEAWARGLVLLSGRAGDPGEAAALFSEALEIYKRAPALPLDSHELDILSARLEQAGPAAPDPASLQSLWSLQDELFEHRGKKFPQDPEIPAAWGRAYYARALRQSDPRIFKNYFAAGTAKMSEHVAASPSPAAALASWGAELEFGALPALGYLTDADGSDLDRRAAEILELSLASYRGAHDLDPGRLGVVRALARVMLKLAVRLDETSFAALVDESERLSRTAVSRDPDPAGAWLRRGLDCLEASEAWRFPMARPAVGAGRGDGSDGGPGAGGTPDGGAPGDPGEAAAPWAGDRLTALAYAAFHQYLASRPTDAGSLRSLADRVWRAAEARPDHRPRALALLLEVCQRLLVLDPADPDFHFARGLILLALLADAPDWPDDLAYSGSAAARATFDEALASQERGLELLSRADLVAPGAVPGFPGGGFPAVGGFPAGGPAPPGGDPDLSGRAGGAPGAWREDRPRPWGWPGPRDREFLSDEPQPGATLSSAGFQERLGTTLKMELGRFLTLAGPETLPPWLQLRLAGTLRRMASSGYPPAVDQMAFWRLAEMCLTRAQLNLDPLADGPGAGAEAVLAGLSGRTTRPTLLARIYAERGLLLAEMSLLAKPDREFLLTQAENLWRLAEEESPGSAAYARARWAAWGADRETLAPLLRHAAEEQEHLLWPPLAEAALEPAFRDLVGQSWFRAAWFGYDR